SCADPVDPVTAAAGAMPMSFAEIFATLVVMQGPTSATQQSGPAPTPAAIAADTGMMRHANKRTPPLAFATRVGAARGGIRLDGRLDEAVWAPTPARTQVSSGTTPAGGTA